MTDAEGPPGRKGYLLSCYFTQDLKEEHREARREEAQAGRCRLAEPVPGGRRVGQGPGSHPKDPGLSPRVTLRGFRAVGRRPVDHRSEEGRGWWGTIRGPRGSGCDPNPPQPGTTCRRGVQVSSTGAQQEVPAEHRAGRRWGLAPHTQRRGTARSGLGQPCFFMSREGTPPAPSLLALDLVPPLSSPTPSPPRDALRKSRQPRTTSD